MDLESYLPRRHSSRKSLAIEIETAWIRNKNKNRPNGQDTAWIRNSFRIQRATPKRQIPTGRAHKMKENSGVTVKKGDEREDADKTIQEVGKNRPSMLTLP